MGREFELKFQGTPQVLETIQREMGPFSPFTMETTYLDTPSGSLSQRRWMLRRRLENGQMVYCLKVPLADGSRGEWESHSLEQLCCQPVPEDFPQLLRQGIQPVCGTRFTRLAKTLSLPQATVELALDQGQFLAGQRQQPFWEVEVELKSGQQQAAEAFAQALAQRFGLSPQEKSKAQRARELGADR